MPVALPCNLASTNMQSLMTKELSSFLRVAIPLNVIDRFLYSLLSPHGLYIGYDPHTCRL